jgi:hypothetical protein
VLTKMRRYYALLGALMFSVICTSLYLMTENLTNTSQGLQFEPIKVIIALATVLKQPLVFSFNGN